MPFLFGDLTTFDSLEKLRYCREQEKSLNKERAYQKNERKAQIIFKQGLCDMYML